jgi:hypothetical protein
MITKNNVILDAINIADNDDSLQQKLIKATRLWNEIDCEDNPEPLWNVMQRLLPFAFYGKSANEFRFTYANTEKIKNRMRSCYLIPPNYESHDMVIDRTGIRFVTIDGQTSAAIVCSLNYENEDQRTIDSVLSLD